MLSLEKDSLNGKTCANSIRHVHSDFNYCSFWGLNGKHVMIKMFLLYLPSSHVCGSQSDECLVSSRIKHLLWGCIELCIKCDDAAEPWRLIPSVRCLVVQSETHQNVVPKVLCAPLCLSIWYLFVLLLRGWGPRARAQPQWGLGGRRGGCWARALMKTVSMKWPSGSDASWAHFTLAWAYGCGRVGSSENEGGSVERDKPGCYCMFCLVSSMCFWNRELSLQWEFLLLDAF